jgi:hypothetical protein
MVIAYASGSAQYYGWNDLEAFGGSTHSDVADGDLMIYNGFHGEMADSSTDYGNYQDFVDNSRYDGIGTNWILEMYRTGVSFPNVVGTYDICPVSVVWQCTTGGVTNILYYGGLEDGEPPDHDCKPSYIHYPDCDPLNGPEL